jgi:O-methyltransferase involved in polyketide biosynthesis
VPEVDLRTDRAHTARVYDYLLGGKTNYAADRAAGDGLISVMPRARATARRQRGFMHRTCRHIAEAGITQFLDIGSGIPTEPNLHQIVHAARPESRVVYVDNDPIVLAHAAALMSGPGTVAYLQADARDPEAILAAPQVRETLDLTRPVSVSVIGLLHFLDDDTVRRLLDTVVGALAPGSYLSITQATYDNDRDGSVRGTTDVYAKAGISGWARTYDEVEALLHGLEILPPGIVPCAEWRPDPTRFEQGARDLSIWGAVARKP